MAKVREELTRLKEDRVPLEDLIMTRSVSNLDSYKVIQPHVSMAMRLRSMGIPIEPGIRLEYVFTVPGVDRDGAMSYLPKSRELTDQSKHTTSLLELDSNKHVLDKQYYVKKQVAASINPLAHLIGWCTFC